MSELSVHPYARACAESLVARSLVARIWARDATAWLEPAAADPGSGQNIVSRLGWLTAPRQMQAHVGALTQVAEALRRDGFRKVHLLGMGGSSLCALVLRDVLGVRPGHLELDVLDTTDDYALQDAAARLDGHALVLVASKSGTTVEVSSMERFFAARMAEIRGGQPSAGHFIAITDSGTPLERMATARGYRQTFLNPSDVGGRFSALSLFGLVPAAFMGQDVAALLRQGEAMAEACRSPELTNPGLVLGAFMGAGALAGRDKLTVVLPPSLASFGLWIEQLVAESTGKEGKGLLPVVGEPLGALDVYGDDRLFVALDTEQDPAVHAVLDRLETHGHPVLRLPVGRMEPETLGAEFFRWEFGVAVAGAVLNLNPFDEPDVKAAKDRTGELLARYAESGRLPDEFPTTTDAGVSVVATIPTTGTSPEAMVRAAIHSIRPGDYAAFLSYLPPDTGTDRVLDELRRDIRARTHAATTLGTGPRYLHSTGQYHKGGRDRGVFFLLTADDRTGTPIPGLPYSFAVLKRAQALGDFRALKARDRRVVRLHFGADPEEQARTLRRVFQAALKPRSC